MHLKIHREGKWVSYCALTPTTKGDKEALEMVDLSLGSTGFMTEGTSPNLSVCASHISHQYVQ